jgi:hypothetical protein
MIWIIDAYFHELHSCIGSLSLKDLLELFAESDSDTASGSLHIISNIADVDDTLEPKVKRKAYALTRAMVNHNLNFAEHPGRNIPKVVL